MKRSIENRSDVNLLVRSFYTHVRADDLIGPVFSAVITSEADWETHFEKLTDFWETNLFFKQAYKGNPMRKHMEVSREKGPIHQAHFDRWLALWTNTIDTLFVGDLAERAKQNAGNIAPLMLSKIRLFSGKPGNSH